MENGLIVSSGEVNLAFWLQSNTQSTANWLLTDWQTFMAFPPCGNDSHFHYKFNCDKLYRAMPGKDPLWSVAKVHPLNPASKQAALTSRNYGQPIVTPLLPLKHACVARLNSCLWKKPETKVFLCSAFSPIVASKLNLFNYPSCVPVSNLRYLLYLNVSSNLLSAVLGVVSSYWSFPGPGFFCFTIQAC